MSNYSHKIEIVVRGQFAIDDSHVLFVEPEMIKKNTLGAFNWDSLNDWIDDLWTNSAYWIKPNAESIINDLIASVSLKLDVIHARNLMVPIMQYDGPTGEIETVTFSIHPA